MLATGSVLASGTHTWLIFKIKVAKRFLSLVLEKNYKPTGNV